MILPFFLDTGVSTGTFTADILDIKHFGGEVRLLVSIFQNPNTAQIDGYTPITSIWTETGTTNEIMFAPNIETNDEIEANYGVQTHEFLFIKNLTGQNPRYSLEFNTIDPDGARGQEPTIVELASSTLYLGNPLINSLYTQGSTGACICRQANGRLLICEFDIANPPAATTLNTVLTTHFDVEQMIYTKDEDTMLVEIDPSRNDPTGPTTNYSLFSDNYILAVDLTAKPRPSAVVAQRAIMSIPDPSNNNIFYYLFVDANGGLQIATGNLSNFTFE